ncbi:hypothetical protein GM415_16935 [Pseudodesulfovibrio cashew]|uniref:MotA/TolQ/ExbB proton channel domain-containing protein n=1 Tax=Pseudodesulfovibrio cashew TaxID=2678688 RepID=A0A6I6JFX6_9BACT|nr:MotA/TolQ/ExbB proton channel family protein [Pseudodesulfovibrio cashew]QGY41736.1 hypothetical protein GM415_16935 [Pseudodesulfovibrio cashew]
MPDLIRAVLDFAEAGGVTMIPLLLCCVGMWYCILRTWLDIFLSPQTDEAHPLALEFTHMRSGRERVDSRLADKLAEAQCFPSRRRLAMAGAMASAAPLLGLFGTVTGMIETFDSVARFGMANPKALSSGISTAMISTQTGLAVAVPGLIAIHFLRGRVFRKRERLERLGATLVRRNAS